MRAANVLEVFFCYMFVKYIGLTILNYLFQAAFIQNVSSLKLDCQYVAIITNKHNNITLESRKTYKFRQPCTKPCLNICEHKKSNLQCHEPCDPSEKPCPKMLKCGHYCIGFCGARYPRLCRICNSTQLKNIFSGLDINTRLVLILECKHLVENKSK